MYPQFILVCIHELVVRARQLDSVRPLHRNRRAAGSIPARGPCAAFFATSAPGYRSKLEYNLPQNFHQQKSFVWELILLSEMAKKSRYYVLDYNHFPEIHQPMLRPGDYRPGPGRDHRRINKRCKVT